MIFVLFIFFLTKHTGILYAYAMTSKLKLITERVIKSSLFNKNRWRQGNSAGQRIQESHTSKNSLPIKNHALSDDHKKRVQIWCSRLQLKVFDQELFKLWQRSMHLPPLYFHPPPQDIHPPPPLKKIMHLIIWSEVTMLLLLPKKLSCLISVEVSC